MLKGVMQGLTQRAHVICDLDEDLLEELDLLEKFSLIMNTKHDAPQKHELKSIINFDNKHTKWETRYHFAQKKSSNKRLPALDKQYNLHQAMDLDEDLPVNPVSTSKHQNQRVAYTSPGERIISPVKRPSAPSPPASSYFKYNEKNSDSEAENSL